jgi:hypothetical protein
VKRRFALAVALVILVVAATVVRATQIVYRSPEQLGEQSVLVVHGRVTSVESSWNEKRTKIFTTTQVEIDDTYKGANRSTVDIVQLGGTVDNVRVNVSGSLSWRPGEEVVLFLEPYEGKYAVSGFSQGKFNVTRDPVTGKAFVRRPALEGVEVTGAPSSDGTTKSLEMNDVPLDVFINRALGSNGKGGSR